MRDFVYMSDSNFTFHSNAYDTVYWLDHVVSSVSLHQLISEIDVLRNYHVHFPSLCVYKLELNRNTSTVLLLMMVINSLDFTGLNGVD